MQSALEDKLTHSYKEGMIAFLKSHPEHFNEAIELAISDYQPYAWRAAWLIWSCMDYDDKRLQKYTKHIVHSLNSKNDRHQRELLKILLQMNLNEKYSGSLFDKCVNVWEQIDKTPSVRFTALKLMIKVAKAHPSLSKEIALLTQDRYLEPLSPAAKKSISKMMNELLH